MSNGVEQSEQVQILEERCRHLERSLQVAQENGLYWKLQFMEMYKAVRESDKGVRRLRAKLDRANQKLDYINTAIEMGKGNRYGKRRSAGNRSEDHSSGHVVVGGPGGCDSRPSGGDIEGRDYNSGAGTGSSTSGTVCDAWERIDYR